MFKIFATKLYHRQNKVIQTLHNFTEVIIKTRRDELVQSSQQGSEELDFNNETGKRSKKLALLDILLKSSVDGEPLSNEAIREEVDTFMFGVKWSAEHGNFSSKFMKMKIVLNLGT